MAEPLLPVGTFGTHIVQNHGVYAFAGTVPNDIKIGGYATEQAAIDAFADWFVAQDEQFKREHIHQLRDDVLECVFSPLTAS